MTAAVEGAVLELSPPSNPAAITERRRRPTWTCDSSAMPSHTTADLGLGSMIGRRARLTPDLAALTFEGETWTYAEMLERIDRFAAVLADGGVGAATAWRTSA